MQNSVRAELLRFSIRSDSSRYVDCDLSEAEIREIFDEPSRTWLVNEEALRSVEDDFQAIVNCSEEGDIILLDVEDTLQFQTRVTLPWRLTLSGNVRNPRPRNGVFPASGRKQRLLCPRDDQGVFFIR